MKIENIFHMMNMIFINELLLIIVINYVLINLNFF